MENYINQQYCLNKPNSFIMFSYMYIYSCFVFLSFFTYLLFALTKSFDYIYVSIIDFQLILCLFFLISQKNVQFLKVIFICQQLLLLRNSFKKEITLIFFFFTGIDSFIFALEVWRGTFYKTDTNLLN